MTNPTWPEAKAELERFSSGNDTQTDRAIRAALTRIEELEKLVRVSIASYNYILGIDDITEAFSTDELADLEQRRSDALAAINGDKDD